MAIGRAICTPANIVSARMGNNVGFLGNGAERVVERRRVVHASRSAAKYTVWI